MLDFVSQAIGADVLSLIIFGAMIVLFVLDVFPMATTAILGCGLMVLFGVCKFSDAFSSFASSTVVLTIGVMVIGQAISETGVAAVIGEWIVRISKGSQRKLIVGTYLVSAVMSAFLTNSAVLAIFLPIVIGVAESNKSIKAKNLVMPIAIACIIGGACTLVGSTQQLTAQGLLEEAGLQTFGVFDFTPVGVLILLLGLVYCLTIGLKRGEKIWGGEAELVDDGRFTEQKVELHRGKTIAITVIFVATVVLYITEAIPLAITSTLGALACIITRCISQEKAIKAVNWNIVGRLGGCLGMANVLSKSGGTALISDFFMKYVGERLSPFLLFAILVLLTQLMSEFTSNSTAIIITLPIVIGIASAKGLNPYTYALGMTIASGVAVSCPLASSTLGMSMMAGYRFADYFKYGLWLDLVSYAVILLTVPLLYGLTA